MSLSSLDLDAVCYVCSNATSFSCISLHFCHNSSNLQYHKDARHDTHTHTHAHAHAHAHTRTHLALAFDQGLAVLVPVFHSRIPQFLLPSWDETSVTRNLKYEEGERTLI